MYLKLYYYKCYHLYIYLIRRFLSRNNHQIDLLFIIQNALHGKNYFLIYLSINNFYNKVKPFSQSEKPFKIIWWNRRAGRKVTLALKNLICENLRLARAQFRTPRVHSTGVVFLKPSQKKKRTGERGGKKEKSGGWNASTGNTPIESR